MNVFHWILIGLTLLMLLANFSAQPKGKKINKESVLGSIITSIYIILIICSAWH